METNNNQLPPASSTIEPPTVESVKPDPVPAPTPTPPANTISLRVVAQDGGEILFRVKKTTRMKTLMDAYCQRMTVSPSAIRFLFDGARVSAESTAEELGMEDRDIIDAVLQQVGGAV